MPGSFFIKFAWSDDEMVAGGNKVMEKLGKSLLVARTRLRKLTHQRESSTKKNVAFYPSWYNCKSLVFSGTVRYFSGH